MLQNGATLFYYRLGKTLSQIGAASLFQIGAVITNQGNRYYKIIQLLQIGAKLITKNYGQVLQIKTIITNWSITLKSVLFKIEELCLISRL